MELRIPILSHSYADRLFRLKFRLFRLSGFSQTFKSPVLRLLVPALGTEVRVGLPRKYRFRAAELRPKPLRANAEDWDKGE